MNVGFVGFGEADSSIAIGLNEEGVDNIFCFDAMQDSPKGKEKFEQRLKNCCGTKLGSAADVCKNSDIVFSATPSNCAVSAAKGALPGVNESTIYVDVSTCTPLEKKEIGQLIEAHGGSFIDGAMLGALLKDKHKVPMLLCGKNAAKVKSMMEPYNMKMTVVDGEIGTATSIKFIRSIASKGVSCLILESLQAAQKYGVEDTIVDSLIDSFGSEFLKIIDGYLSGAIIHAERREHEMQNVVDFLKSESLPYSMAEATRLKLKWILDSKIRENFTGDVPRNWKGVLADWKLN